MKLPRPTYLALAREVKRRIDEGIKDNNEVSIGINRMPWCFKVEGKAVTLRPQTVKEVWPQIAAKFNLCDDGTGCDTWTLKEPNGSAG